MLIKMKKLVILNIILLNLVKNGRSSLKIMTNYICEGSNMYINCSSSEKLSILRANYGRLSISMCNSQGPPVFTHRLKLFGMVMVMGSNPGLENPSILKTLNFGS